MRLNKYLAECGVSSRRGADELIEQGRITVNGKLVIELGYQVDESNDEIKLDGEKLRLEEKVYYLLNKPKGTITTTSDEKGRKTVIDLIPSNHKLFPVGRLDYNTRGVLILTNDGEFANKLLHPSNKIPREYIAKLDNELKVEDKLKLLKGIMLDDRKSKFTSLSFPVKNNFKKVCVTTVEGRNHFVKRMFGSLGYQVKELERTSFGNFNTESLKPGEYKKITKEKMKEFFSKYKN